MLVAMVGPVMEGPWQTPPLVRYSWITVSSSLKMPCFQERSIWDHSPTCLWQMKPSPSAGTSWGLFQEPTSLQGTESSITGCPERGWLLKTPSESCPVSGTCTVGSLVCDLKMWMRVWRRPVSCTTTSGGTPGPGGNQYQCQRGRSQCCRIWQEWEATMLQRRLSVWGRSMLPTSQPRVQCHGNLGYSRGNTTTKKGTFKNQLH